ncbi:unnamed protein product [Parnassius mnemosyne]|uniref:UDP-glucuronosyltransferase n=1 Tax=Parnassius mnemosyne TaxID=213953 RepID=A0AAV1L6E3_9NEOP
MCEFSKTFRKNCIAITLLFVLIFCAPNVGAAKILAVFPVPSISHQVVFRPLTQELVLRGHELTVITPNPAFAKGQAPQNLIEIDVQNISYAVKNAVIKEVSENSNNLLKQLMLLSQLFLKVFEAQLQNKEFQRILHLDENYFDLLLIEACATGTLGLSHVFKAPVIQVSSLGALMSNYQALGIPMHPFLYPASMRTRVYNLTIAEKMSEILGIAFSMYMADSTENAYNQLLRKNFGDDVPNISILTNNIDMLLLNTNPTWSGSYPVPPNVIFIGGIHQNKLKELPKDLKSYLDSSKTGVIYVSFGSNVKMDMFSPKIIETFVTVFSELPYDILWKWDQDEPPGLPENVKISKWFPQADLLHHPKMKLFITQGGLQSTDEAITAGVPLIGFPILVDQAYNAEKYVHFNIGMKLDINKLTKEQLRNSIVTVISNENYRRNIVKLRALINDQPQPPLERAVWWTEYVLRNGGARHLRSPAANISWFEYLEIKFLIILLSVILTILIILITFVKLILRFFRMLFTRKKLKIN